MTTDLEKLVGTLRARAEADTDADALLARVGTAHRRRRNRRTMGAAAAGVLAVTGLGALVVPHVLPDGYAIPAPPAAPNASLDAASVGSDPWTIHFGVGRFPYPVRTTTWSVLDGVETLSLWGNTVGLDSSHDADGTGFFVDLTLASAATSPTPDPTSRSSTLEQPHGESATIAGQPALVVTGTDPASLSSATRISWQPINGVRAELSVRGPVPVSKALTFAQTLRLDVSHRCVLRVRPAAVPGGARVTGCKTVDGSLNGELTIRGPQGVISIFVSAVPVFDAGGTPGATARARPTLPTLANGWPYEELDPSGNTQHYTAHLRIPDPYVEVWSQGGYGLADVLRVAGGLELSTR